MERSLKLPRSRKSLGRKKYAYTIPEKGVMYSDVGDPIILDGHDKYVCGACFLLLRTLGVHSWLRSPLEATPRTLHMQMTPFAVSKCGCEINTLTPTPSLFPNSPQKEESISTAYSLTCRCLSEIRAKVDGLFPMDLKEPIELLQSSGERAMSTRHKLTALDAWLIT